MKEDILEQMVDEYLQHDGYFTRHNLKFKPPKDHADYDMRADSVHSDIDVIGINPLRAGPERVVVVSCKSWQQGFNPQFWCNAIEQNKEFTYITAVTKLLHRWPTALVGSKTPPSVRNLAGNPIRIPHRVVSPPLPIHDSMCGCHRRLSIQKLSKLIQQNADFWCSHQGLARLGGLGAARLVVAYVLLADQNKMRAALLDCIDLLALRAVNPRQVPLPV
ncbi:hypothetical protein AWV79_14215 [Cupriavidus sp. UYMMa02A]|nr:hypothetical protein AWV79_14215 [Cupriavidus sp. UYMMa02A]